MRAYTSSPNEPVASTEIRATSANNRLQDHLDIFASCNKKRELLAVCVPPGPDSIFAVACGTGRRLKTTKIRMCGTKAVRDAYEPRLLRDDDIDFCIAR